MAVAPPPETKLQILRRNLLDEAQAIKLVPLWAMHKQQFTALIEMSRRHIDNLIEENYTKLPWPVELFGRAYVLREGQILMHFPTFTSTAKSFFVGRNDPLFLYDKNAGTRTEDPQLPQMSYGKPVDPEHTIYTGKLAAILLYQDGNVARLAPWQYGFIKYLNDSAPSQWTT